MSRAHEFIEELTAESAKTRRLFERIPEEKLSWRPHPKSSSLGSLALHVAQLSGAIAELVSHTEVEPPDVPRPEAESVAQLLSTLETSVAAGIARLRTWSDEDMKTIWRMKRGGTTILEIPRGQVIRAIMFNHAYHHRGQLTVYLRLLDVPLPAIFGPSADEMRFG